MSGADLVMLPVLAKSAKRRNGAIGKRLLDDRWLNQTHAVLDEAARACESDFGSKPSIEDFRRLLATVFGGGELGRWFADGDQHEVTEVVFKLARRTASTSARIGDILSLPIGKSKFAFARVMNDDKYVGLLVDVFRATSSTRGFDPRIAASGRAMHPVYVNPVEAFERGRWSVVAHDHIYRVNAADKRLEFSSHSRAAKLIALTPLDRTRKPRLISERQWRALEPYALRSGEEIEEMIRDRLG